MFIVGIEPKAPGLHIFSRLYLPRLGLPLLLTMARQLGHRCAVYCEEITPIPWDKVAKAEMILISTITSTAPRAYSFIPEIRKRNPNAPILMGGPHVTFLPEEALDKGADYVFRHEADVSFPLFLQWWLSSPRDNQELFTIAGLSFRIGNQYHHTQRPGLVDLDTLPTPDLDLIFGYEKPEIIPLITSRGCTYNCEFCSEVEMFGRHYRFRPEQKVIEDIRYYDRRYGRIDIFIAEDNFGADPDRVERLCGQIIKHGLVRPYSGQVRLDLAKFPELVALMNRAGFERAYIGYESINPKSLEEIKKGLRYESMPGYTKVFHRCGISIHAMWILGLDYDSLETVKQTVRCCIRWRIETSQFIILVPLPGAPLYERLKAEGRIFNHDWSKYDGHHVNFYPKGMTARQLQVAVMLEAMPWFYNRWQTVKILAANLARTAVRFLRFKTRRPFQELRSSIITLLARRWGKGATRKMKKPIREYLKQIP